MSLGQRVKQVSAAAPATGDPAGDATLGPLASPAQSRGQVDPFSALKQRAQDALYSRLGHRVNDSSLSEQQLRGLVVHELARAIEEEQTALDAAERDRLVKELTDDVIGYGPIERYLADPTVTEVMVNADEAIYIERDGRLELTPMRYSSCEHLRQVIERIVSQVGRRIDESSPTCDARLPDGSRVNAVIPPLAVDGPQLTIRKFSKRAYRMEDLVSIGTLTEPVARFLAACVEGRCNILISGGTGTGKTTMLNALSGYIPGDERIVTIEDAVELQLRQRHVIRLEARPPNIEGKGEVTIRDLVRNSLRMRPDRIVVGEVRGGEALDMLQAMNTGHEGSLSTLHANSPRDVLSRLETMVLMAGFDLPVRAIREQVASAMDLIVHLSRLRDGTRRITKIVEVSGLEGEVITLNDIFTFDFAAGRDDLGSFRGTLVPTGLRPSFAEKLEHVGLDLEAGLFGTNEAAWRPRKGTR